MSEQRYGEHRAIAAALLLEKRQADLVAGVENDVTATDENDAEENSSVPTIPQPIYQVNISLNSLRSIQFDQIMFVHLNHLVVINIYHVKSNRCSCLNYPR